MRPSLASSLPLHRLLAALLTLTVLLTTLGWTHARCGAPASARAAASHGVATRLPDEGVLTHADGPDGHCDEAGHGAPVDRAPPDAPGHEQHDAPASGVCALAAHCAAAVVVTATISSASEVEVEALPLASSVGRPLDPASQPASPPPKA